MRSLAMFVALMAFTASVIAQQPLSPSQRTTPPSIGMAIPKMAPRPKEAPSELPRIESAKDNPPTRTVPPPAKFDASSLRLKYESGSWQLWAGTMLLKDFGRAEADAHEALQLFRDLRVDSRGTIGGVFEYWLAAGEAPTGVVRNRKVFDFNPATLRVQQLNGGWALADDHRVLYNFGTSKSDAEAAHAVCRAYGFNQLGYIGHPTPALKYLMFDKESAKRQRGPAPLVPVSTVSLAQEQARRPISIPKEGVIGTVQPLDFRRLDLRRSEGSWQLVADRTPLGAFGPNERDGRQTLQALQHFRCSEYCRIGDGGFGFFLSNGRAPQGSVIGLPARSLRTESLVVRQTGDSWEVCEHQRLVTSFKQEVDARRALAAIKHYQFDTIVTAGANRLGGLMLFVKSR